MQAWINKNRSYLGNRFPKLAKRVLPHLDNITTSSFAFGVAEEFILISLITVVSFAMNSSGIWIGSFIAFTIHLLIHCLQALMIRRYIPAIVTSLICLPVCIYIIKLTLQTIPINMIIGYSILCFIIMVINIMIIHKLMAIFGKWIARYEQQ